MFTKTEARCGDWPTASEPKLGMVTRFQTVGAGSLLVAGRVLRAFREQGIPLQARQLRQRRGCHGCRSAARRSSCVGFNNSGS